MARFLIVCFDTALAAGLGAALARAGVEAAFADPRADLAAQIGASRHENAAMLLAGWPDDAPAWIGNGFPPCPVSVVGAASAGCDSTCAGWWPPGIAAAPDELAAALALDSARWRREAGLRAELAAARAQLDERKWVERAKGLLMHARGASENDAFRLLREASMHANLRLAQVSRSVIEATAWAEAVNRAGQLRMLSQRLVKLAAQALAGIDLRRAETLQRKAARRAQANLDH
ncbi:MAG: ANTAR domain-containing protein, partial [Burkholderiales bacterium]|nr:ANTAR domain-containing protein [Burkholderiales bacterium]